MVSFWINACIWPPCKWANTKAVPITTCSAITSRHHHNSITFLLTATAHLGFVGVHQRGCSSHHGAAARPWQRGDLRLGWLLWLFLQHVPQPLQVVHQWPLCALLGPVRLQQAAQHSHVKVRGVARLLARWDHQGHPVPKSRSRNVNPQIL